MKNLYKDFPLNLLSTSQTGGKAANFVEVKSISELAYFIRYSESKNMDRIVIGNGSNILFPDKGFEGIVIKNNWDSIIPAGEIVKVASGTQLQKLVDFSVFNTYSGMEKMTMIPGTVGGAISGNSGAYGQNISDYLFSVTVLENGKIRGYTKEKCHFGYRDSIFRKKPLTILFGEFQFKKGNRNEIMKNYTEVNLIREVKFPKNLKCPGSFFKNVPFASLPEEKRALIPESRIRNDRIHIGWLLETVGATGLKHGSIIVSEMHSNIFINQGEGKTTDYLGLSWLLAERIKNKYGIIPNPEVIFVKR